MQMLLKIFSSNFRWSYMRDNCIELSCKVYALPLVEVICFMDIIKYENKNLTHYYLHVILRCGRNTTINIERNDAY